MSETIEQHADAAPKPIRQGHLVALVAAVVVAVLVGALQRAAGVMAAGAIGLLLVTAGICVWQLCRLRARDAASAFEAWPDADAVGEATDIPALAWLDAARTRHVRVGESDEASGKVKSAPVRQHPAA